MRIIDLGIPYDTDDAILISIAKGRHLYYNSDYRWFLYHKKHRDSSITPLSDSEVRNWVSNNDREIADRYFGIQMEA